MFLYLYCFIYYLLAGICTSIVYHRILVHRSAEMIRPLKYFFTLLALPAGTPIQWVGNHRYHHNFTDVIGDPHSPVVDGFWYSHCGWYIGTKNPFLCFLYSLAGPLRTIYDSYNRPRSNQQFNYLAKDISKDSFMLFISKPIPYMLILITELALNFAFVFYFWKIKGIIFLWLTMVMVYNIGDSVDSFGHLFGKKNMDGKNSSRNNLVLGVLAFGDGWHANHHKFPWSAKHGIGKAQPDLSWIILKIFRSLKLVKNLKTINYTYED
jgi:stearoyl-CoA desaturase (delta-9 desaturase)